MHLPILRNHKNHHDDLCDEYWHKQCLIVDAMRARGAAQYANSISGIASAFVSTDNSLRCIDEGTPGGIHLAGSGIFLDEKTALSYLEKAHIDGVYSHTECGAVVLYAKLMYLDFDKAEKYARQWAEHLAGKMGVPYRGHIAPDKMGRPKGLHIARVAYYDATGVFEPTKFSELPKGFIISRRFIDAAYAKKEIDLAIQITCGSHGFGKRICRENPFVIVVIADSRQTEFSGTALGKEIEDIARASEGKVVVEIFDASSFLTVG